MKWAWALLGRCFKLDRGQGLEAVLGAGEANRNGKHRQRHHSHAALLRQRRPARDGCMMLIIFIGSSSSSSSSSSTGQRTR